MYFSRALGMFRITLFILLVACGAAWSEVAAAWPGAGEDPHPGGLVADY